MYSSLRVFGFVFVYVCICVYVCAFVRILYNVLFAPLREALLLLLRSIFPGLLVDPPLPVPPYCSRSTENSSIARSLRAVEEKLRANRDFFFAGGNLKIKEREKKKENVHGTHVFTCHQSLTSHAVLKFV